MRMVPRRQKLLTAAVMAALLGVPHYGHAFKTAPEYVYYNGKPMAEMQFLTEGMGRSLPCRMPDPKQTMPFFGISVMGHPAQGS